MRNLVSATVIEENKPEDEAFYLDYHKKYSNKLKFLYYKRKKTITRARGIAAGVIPKFQNSGVESGIFYLLRKVMDTKPQYTEFELSWVGDFNPKMISLDLATGAVHAKTHHTYRYLFDRKLPFQRFMEDAVDESKLPENVLKL